MPHRNPQPALLVLEDGAYFEGYSFGAPPPATGEVVFNTGMTGYQEIATDPSYAGQMVCFTYPLIGNYGVSDIDWESRRPWIEAAIVREYMPDYSNWAANGSFGDYLARHGVPGIYGVDTRALVRHLRTHGTMRGILARADVVPLEELVAAARRVVPLSEQDLVAETSSPAPLDLAADGAGGGGQAPPEDDRVRIALLDCGTKSNIARSLTRRGALVRLFPHDTPLDEILAWRPDGVVISNGPGDPAVVENAFQVTKGVVERRLPLFGICLGHQLLGRAAGGRTNRLKYGHHGVNHPVKDLLSGRVHITSQNHEFQVDPSSIDPSTGFYVSQINLNDGSVEGLAHRELPIFSVQYHPEANPGPQDNQYLFDRFLAMVRERRQSQAGAGRPAGTDAHPPAGTRQACEAR